MLLVVVVGTVVGVPMEVGEQGEAITGGISQLLSPIVLLLIPVILLHVIRFLSSDRGSMGSSYSSLNISLEIIIDIGDLGSEGLGAVIATGNQRFHGSQQIICLQLRFWLVRPSRLRPSQFALDCKSHLVIGFASREFDDLKQVKFKRKPHLPLRLNSNGPFKILEVRCFSITLGFEFAKVKGEWKR
ncbi:hypothetical protein NE237_012695 [Protea cynaroides]|uniref:Uncharacterized protein n=1 Tax=Protea cynaroides TaxID=273540 RepID=A0A9Q0GXA5_9MAGN|nr:hypothetical protein NE237_012695 [Protea cynaroides]